MEKTSTYKKYKFGFVLSEQELRRIIQICHQYIIKNVDEKNCHQVITAYLADGSVIESETVDTILSLENSGSKSIERVVVHFDDGKADYEKENSPDPEWGIWVSFQNAQTRSDDWTSVTCLIMGQSRDWAFLLSSELDEKIRKIKTPSFNYIFGRPWFVAIPGAAGFALSMLGTMFLSSKRYENIPILLENAYKSGQIKDPIEALIFIERIKESPMSIEQTVAILSFIFLGFLIPFGLAWIVGNIMPYMAPAYNFYWGDYVSFYDKRRSVQSIFWTVVVLGIIVSIISAYILRFLP